MLKKYIKGEKKNVVTRISQVSCITLYVPSSEECSNYLYDGLITLCNHYIDNNDSNSLLLIPCIDFYNVLLFVNKSCKEKNIESKYITTIINIIKSFINLKQVSVVFKDDDDKLKKSYEKIINIDVNNFTNDVIDELANVYSIDIIDMYLGDMFDQDIVDLINKHFISNGIISNSYLEREFLIEFEFDEYISYINMIIENNIDMLSMYDENIIDYLRTFPYIIGDVSKPKIRLYTNYRDV
jgi:hypothetical protein